MEKNFQIQASSLAIPPDAFNARNVAVLDIGGNSHCGRWTFKVTVAGGSPGHAVEVGKAIIDIGPIMPDEAVQPLKTWIASECILHGLEVLSYKPIHFDPSGPTTVTAIVLVRRPASRHER